MSAHFLRKVRQRPSHARTLHQRIHLGYGSAVHVKLAPDGNREIAVLPQHHRMYLRPAQAQVSGDLGSEPQRVRPGPRAQHALPTQPLCKHLDAKLDRIGLNDDRRSGPRTVGEGIRILHKDLPVGAPQRSTVDGRRRIGGDRETGKHDHQICFDGGGIEHDLDGRRVVDECILEIGAQTPEFIGAASAMMAYELQAAGGRQQATVEQLGGQLASATPGGPDNRDVHIALLALYRKKEVQLGSSVPDGRPRFCDNAGDTRSPTRLDATSSGTKESTSPLT